jgi:hypothetical protein
MRTNVTNGVWQVLCRVLGVILLLASLLKAWHLQDPALDLGGLMSHPTSRITVVELEALIAGWLLFGVAGRRTWMLTLTLWLVFLTVSIHETVAGHESCGCFGRVKLAPAYTAAFDCVTCLSLAFCRPSKCAIGVGKFTLPRALVRVMVIALLPASLIVASWRPVVEADLKNADNESNSFGIPESLVVLEPKKWIGKTFLLYSHIDVGKQLLVGRWVLLFVHHDCQICANTVPKYQAAAINRTVHLAIIEMPPHSNPVEQTPWSMGPALLGTLDESRQWFLSTPTGIFCIDGKVISVADSKQAINPPSSWFSSQASLVKQ